MRSFLLLLVAILLLCRPAPGQQEDPNAPVLRLDTGMHTGAIQGISTDRSGKWTVSCAGDKVVRVWETATGRQLRLIRTPGGKGSQGQLLAVALSPDGKTVAAGGVTGTVPYESFSVYLFDRQSGKMTRRLSTLPGPIGCLRFSPDGTKLVVGLNGGGTRHFGVKVYTLRTGQLLWEDTDYKDFLQDMHLDRNGRLVVAGGDNNLRLYSPTGAVIARKTLSSPDGRFPISVRFSPDGSRVAVGTGGVPRLLLYSGSDLSGPTTLSADGLRQEVSAVAWSPDGQSVYGSAITTDASFILRRWSPGSPNYEDLPAASETIIDLHTLPDGRLVAASDSSLFLVAADFKKKVWSVDGAHADLSNRASLILAPQGQGVAFKVGTQRDSWLSFSLPDGELRTGKGSADFTTLPRIEAPDLLVRGWEGALGRVAPPSVNGKPLEYAQGDLGNGLAVDPARRRFLIGSNFALTCYSDTGQRLWRAIPGVACSRVNITAENGDIGVAAFTDGTIRWYRMDNGRELLTLFSHADKRRWILWTRSGYYACSPGGESLIGWHVNRGQDSAADFYPASQFRARFYRPDVVRAILTTRDEAEALRLAEASQGQTTPQTPARVTDLLPPVVEIVSPTEDQPADGDLIKVRFIVRTPPDAPVRSIWALVNGRRVSLGGTKGAIDFTATKPVETAASPEREIAVPLLNYSPGETVEIAVLADNQNAISTPATVRVRVGSAPAADSILKPKLYVLAVGVGKYKSNQVGALEFPAKDARDFAAAWKAQGGGLYRAVETRVITDTEATREKVSDGLEWLENNATARDVAIVYLSGHGANDRNQVYHFLTHNFDPDRWRATALPRSELESLLSSLKSKVYLFLDTCASGNVLGGTARSQPDIAGLINELTSAERGVALFAASARFQAALERPEWGNGAFTKAVIEALSGSASEQLSPDAQGALASITGAGKVTLSRLDVYLAERVKQLTRGKQTPTHNRPQTIQDLPIALVK
jgi:WD40 repeat protein